jgi:hypothetical protein
LRQFQENRELQSPKTCGDTGIVALKVAPKLLAFRGRR